MLQKWDKGMRVGFITLETSWAWAELVYTEKQARKEEEEEEEDK